MSKDLFDRLISRAAKEGVIIRDSDAPRYILPLDDGGDDAALMAKAKATTLILTRQIKLVQIEWEGKTLFSFFGLSSNDDFPSGVAEVDLTPGTFALSVLKSNTHPTAPADKIRNTIEEPEADGFDFESISKLFPTIYIYEVSRAHDFHQSKHRVLGSMLSKTYSDGPILLDSDTTEHLTEIFEGGSKHIPFHNLLQGIPAISWEGLFLEAYRCIEQLYSAPNVKKLRDDIGSDLALYDLAALLEEHLSWRPKEADSLSTVLAFCDEAIVSSAYQTLNPGAQPDPDKLYSATARQIYKLRNSIVHYRPDTPSITKNEAEWNEIIRAMLTIVQQIYDRHGEDFFEGPVDTILALEPLTQPVPCEENKKITGGVKKLMSQIFKFLLSWTWGKP